MDQTYWFLGIPVLFNKRTGVACGGLFYYEMNQGNITPIIFQCLFYSLGGSEEFFSGSETGSFKKCNRMIMLVGNSDLIKPG